MRRLEEVEPKQHVDGIDVLLVGDVRVYRDAVAAMLEKDARVHVVATATSDDDIRRQADDAHVIVVMSSDAEATIPRRISTVTGTPMVAVGFVDTAHMIALAEAGVLGFVECESPIDDLITGIESAARGEASCPPQIATALIKRLSLPTARSASTSQANCLTAREQQIVLLIAEGLSNKEIARRLFIQVATVKNHVHNILKKLHVSRREQVAATLRFNLHTPWRLPTIS